ncbi:hypothetical protein [Niveibacterium terrae]|uniref:hypothetical protein n=1 Tax=Niveibacterium terrae TaxID=3373598 RepID=UPI003A90F7C1
MRRALLIGFLVCWASASAENASPALEKLVHERTGLFPLAVDSGVLKPNNERYVAAVATKKKDDGEALLVVFRQDGPRQEVMKSKLFIIGGHTWWSPNFVNGSLLLNGDGSCGGACHGVSDFQFLFKDGELRLAGLEERGVDIDDPNGDSRVVSSARSLNMLTGKVVYSIESCRAADNGKSPWDCASRNRRSRKELSFSIGRRWTLSDFSPELFAEYEIKTKGLNGYLDPRTLKYREY